jgi:hypothetical protein
VHVHVQTEQMHLVPLVAQSPSEEQRKNQLDAVPGSLRSPQLQVACTKSQTETVAKPRLKARFITRR